MGIEAKRTMREEIEYLESCKAATFITVAISTKRFIVARMINSANQCHYRAWTKPLDSATVRRVYDQIVNADCQDYTDETRNAILE